MFLSIIAAALKKFWLVAIAVTVVACLSLYFRLGNLTLITVITVAAVCFLAILLIGIPLEYSRQKK